MHGRLKVKTTAKQEEEKRKERAIKQKKYLGAIHLLFSKKTSNQFDKEALKITTELLFVNPDASTFWNFRREILLELKSQLNESEWQKLCVEELFTSEQCLLKNPKSYGAWHHRDWILQNISDPPYEKERQVCDVYLQKDERNFHCWDHRRLVVNRSDRSLSSELSYTEQLIDTNFSNFSAWHYRSKLLPKLYPPGADTPHPVEEKIFIQELKKVVTAVFTDPSDQSPWFFLRWLLGQNNEAPKIIRIGLVKNEKVELLIVFNKEIRSTPDMEVTVDGQQLSSQPLPYNHKAIWIIPLNWDGETSLDIDVRLSGHPSVQLRVEAHSVLPVSQEASSLATFSEKAVAALEEVLQNCLDLDELDEGNKWVLLTLVNVMWKLDPSKHCEKISERIEQLQTVDPLRKNYYDDLRSLIVMENLFSKKKFDNNFSTTANLKLTRVVWPQNLCFVKEIDLSGNKLKSVNFVTSLVCCRKLSLDGNFIENFTPLKRVRILLSLNNFLVFLVFPFLLLFGY